MWEAQIKIIFPKMEQFRSAFIRKHHEKLMGVMPVRNSNGETIYEPDELELGTLYFICNTKCHVEQKDYEKAAELSGGTQQAGALGHPEL